MVILNYSKTGVAVPDHEAATFVARLIESGGVASVSTENAVHQLQLAVMKGEIAADKALIRHEGKPVPLKAEGFFAEQPEGFCDHSLNAAKAIYRAHAAKVKKSQGGAANERN